MVFSNPWGLLALLALPAILGLHFFHSRRRVRRVGGLHLWQFAQIRMPAGRKLDRFVRNMPLLFQLLTAFLLSMLLAGADIPRESQSRHYTIIADSSVSMLARDKESSIERAVEAFEDWANDRDKYTLVAAGSRASIIAGPFATRDEVIESLKSWTPEDPGCDIEAAVNLAGKFVASAEKILFLTDDETPAKAHDATLEIAAYGEPIENVAIDYADRARATEEMDRVFVTVQAYSKLPVKTTMRAHVGETLAYNEEIELNPGEPRMMSFETRDLAQTMRVSLDADALLADNKAILPPVGVKTVDVHAINAPRLNEYLERVVNVVPNAEMVDRPDLAELVFTIDDAYTSMGRNVRVCLLPDPELERPTTGVLLAQGRDIVLDREQQISEGLPLEGVLWPLVVESAPEKADIFIAWRGQSLLSCEKLSNTVSRLRLNLLTDRTNIFRTTAWPVLVSGLIEECREATPGMTTTGYRVGEKVALRLPERDDLERSFALTRNGAPYAEYNEVPEILADLHVGEYTMTQAGEERLATFAVNLFAPGESDLRSLAKNEPDFTRLAPATVSWTETNRFLFFILFLIIVALTAVSWISQDTYR